MMSYKHQRQTEVRPFISRTPGEAIAFAITIVVFFSGPSLAQSTITETPDAAEIEAAVQNADIPSTQDPWEGLNRKMFSAHLFLDDLFLVPAAKIYRATTPKIARRGIRRFLANIRAPKVLINDILQGEFERGGETLARFVINSTIGFGGFADPAAGVGIGIPPHNEDFGQTLAVWGAGSGPYVFVPLLGPSSIRDGIGAGVDLTFDPLFYIRTEAASIARYSRAGAAGVSARENFLDPLAEIEEKSLDYYASFRSFYLQARKREIANGRTDFSDLPDIGDFEEFDELE